MHQESSKRKQIARRVAVSSIMAMAVLIIVTIITLFMLGYRLNSNSGSIEQYAFLQFSSVPSGATVEVDDSYVGKTPNKTSVPSGKHQVKISKNGYKTWSKTVDIDSGSLTWLNYALLIPNDLNTEPVMNLDSVYDSLASKDSNYLLIQKSADKAEFVVANVSSSSASGPTIVIPDTIYTAGLTSNIFEIESWDESERYVLIKHNYDSSSEWLVLDTQDVANSKNITRTFDIAISKAQFSGNNGNTIYVLNSGDIRKLDLSSETISKTLISNVTDFNYYNESKVITYNSITDNNGIKEANVGAYSESNDDPYILRTINYDENTPLLISTAYYFNENYIAIAEGKKVDILSGSYPNSSTDSTNSLTVLNTLSLDNNVSSVSFSPSGEFVFVRSDSMIASYDLEYQNVASATIEGVTNTTVIKWLNDNYIWYNLDGNLIIREFDGYNANTICDSDVNQDIILTKNSKYIYSLKKIDSGYQLQRTQLVL